VKRWGNTTLAKLHLHPTPPAPPFLIDLGAGAPGQEHVRADLDNMAAALARHHGGIDNARIVMLEAFAACFAAWSADTGRPALARFAFEHAVDAAMAREAAARAVNTRGTL
jgi:hypothetical protein